MVRWLVVSDVPAGEEETPFALARRMHVEGFSAEQVEAALVARGLDATEARVAARAGRGEAGGGPEPAGESAQAALPPEGPPAHPCPRHAEWPVRATCVRCGRFFCARCLREAELLRVPESGQCPDCEARAPVAQGIGGWLVLPALHVLLAPFIQGYWILQDVQALRATDPRFYPPIVIELLFGLGYVALVLTAAVAFFQKKRRTVRLMIAFYSMQFLSGFLSLGLEAWVASLSGRPAQSTGVEFPRTLISAAVWLAYFLNSKRVKATFVVP